MLGGGAGETEETSRIATNVATAMDITTNVTTDVATNVKADPRHEMADKVNKRDGATAPVAETEAEDVVSSGDDPSGSGPEGSKAGEGNKSKQGGVAPATDGEDEEDDESNGGASDDEASDGRIEELPDLESLSAKLEKMDVVLTALHGNSEQHGTTIDNLTNSLEYSQKEIDELKAENARLKQRLGDVMMEDRKTQYKVNELESKVDKIETSTKRKNLIIEGVPEIEGRNENVEKSIFVLFDQLQVHKGINYEGCYRMGPYIKSRTRPIMVSFERQADRDAIYAKRFELKRTQSFQNVWINEDLGALSKRKRGLIRMISKEAQAQGVDCKTGKYFVQINGKRFDDSNLEELPPQLQLTNLKQVMVAEGVLAYQSEHAPFSNFFHCQVIIGKHKFFCLEQAFQFMRAKILDRPLAATKIYMSRDERFIKQKGAELGTSDEWERRKYDVMYECLLRKFEQNEHLKQLLLKTGDIELLEATPDRLWGCGATLSSTVIRNGNWPGKNKHGKILMAVRDEIRRQEKDA